MHAVELLIELRYQLESKMISSDDLAEPVSERRGGETTGSAYEG